ncbi:MAG TPA: IS1182 family transposase [Candidatus Udaeobacter sp.]|nr:IS1182 family transposase [Candidatus Udaeobacter sp.]
MMGRENPPQQSLFYTGINLEKRVRSDHALRKVARLVDFDFVYAEVKESYGYNGNVSVPPPMILKLMLLLVLYNVRSERELMATLAERLDWLWFLGLELDSEIPDHSVLSKARRRWGVELFRSFFERIVWQCVEGGLVDGKKLFCDSSLIEANAACNSVVDTQGLKRYLNPAYRELEARLEEREEQQEHKEDPPDRASRRNWVNQRYTSTTDPEASVVRRGQGKPKLFYQTHRGIDGAYGVITATLVGPGDENEAHRLTDLLWAHGTNSGRSAELIVADSKYGTTANFLECYDRGIVAHIPVLKQTQDKQERRRKIFPESMFLYDPQTDTYGCPGGQTLRKRKHWADRKAFEYVTARGVCQQCPLRIQCTHSQSAGRTLKRHERQEILDDLRVQAQSRTSKKDIQTRQHFMERSFAHGTRFGLKRARWRGQWRVQIQDYLIAVAQNIQLLIAHAWPKPRMVLATAANARVMFCALAPIVLPQQF